MSPVANQPSRIASAVASGRLRYSRNRLGPRTWISPIVSSSSPSSARAVVVDEPDVDARQRRPHGARRGARVGVDGGVHERLGHAVALHDAAAGQLLQARVLGGRQGGRARHEQPGAAQGRAPAPATRRPRRRAAGTSWAPRRASSRRPLSAVAHALGREAPEVQRRPAAPHRTEDPDDQPVDVKQRQPVGDDVGGRSSPTPRRARRGWRRSRGAAGPRPWAARWCPRCRR